MYHVLEQSPHNLVKYAEQLKVFDKVYIPVDLLSLKDKSVSNVYDQFDNEKVQLHLFL